MRGYLIVASISAILFFGAGWTVNKWKHDAGLLDQALSYADAIVAEQEKVDQLSTDLEAARQTKAQKERIITREVTRYVQIVPAVDRCSLPGQWRLLHDAAATGEPPSSPGLDDAKPTPIEDAAALETVAENYQACREWRGQLIGLQRYVKDVCLK